MTENLKKANKMLKENPELLREIAEEMKKSKNPDQQEAAYAAVKTVLGIEMTAEDKEEVIKDSRELTPEQMELVAGGGFLKNVGIFGLNRLIDGANVLCYVVFPGGGFDYVEYD